MGQDLSHNLIKEHRLRLRAPLTVLAASEQLDLLRSSDTAHLLDDVSLIPVELHTEITEAHLAGAGILVVHVDPEVPGSMRRIERVRTLSPALPQIVALKSADVALVRTLLREGVADVVSLPLAPEELLQAAITVLEARAAENGAQVELAPLIAVTRALGGTGGTTLVTHLAAKFADKHASVCLIDLDIQFGRVAEVLGLEPRRNLSDLLDAGTRLDQAFFQSVAVQHASGVDVVAAPRDIIPLESMNVDQLHKVIEIVRREYDFVFLDMPSNLTNWSLSILAEAGSIVMVVEQKLASLRQAKRRLHLFRSVGIGSHVVSVVVNRIERRLFGSISLADVEEALGRNVLQGLHADEQNIGHAQDQGLLVDQVRAKSAYAVDVGKLAETLMQQLEQGSRP